MTAFGIIRRSVCALIALTVASCDSKPRSAEWHSSAASAPQSVAASTPEPDSPVTLKSPSPTAKGSLRFIGYNVENWLLMDRYADHQTVKNAPKPTTEKEAVIRILARHQPDVIGLCEIGEASDLTEIQALLKTAGLDLPHAHFVGGTDPLRHLGLLSRNPITATATPAMLEYRMNGQTFGINRGILDVTIQSNDKSYRFIGCHLKSKRIVEEADQEQMRIHEAHLLRTHIDSILTADPTARLIVYGDFNDSYPSKTVKAITHSNEIAHRLTPIYLKDSHGEAWTHHWQTQDIYSRIDFITLSQSLRSEINYRACRIIDDADCAKASDHRPVLAVFK